MIRQGWLRPPFAFVSAGSLISKKDRLTIVIAARFRLNRLTPIQPLLVMVNSFIPSGKIHLRANLN